MTFPRCKFCSVKLSQIFFVRDEAPSCSKCHKEKVRANDNDDCTDDNDDGEGGDVLDLQTQDHRGPHLSQQEVLPPGLHEGEHSQACDLTLHPVLSVTCAARFSERGSSPTRTNPSVRRTSR